MRADLKTVGVDYLFIYLLGKYLIPPLRGRRAPLLRKEKKGKTREKNEEEEEEERDRGTEDETSYPNPGS